MDTYPPAWAGVYGYARYACRQECKCLLSGIVQGAKKNSICGYAKRPWSEKRGLSGPTRDRMPTTYARQVLDGKSELLGFRQMGW
ncbi:hypothetical protein PoMZ_08137 [Pyricularia oryzae]|uniref:Uncharacterized protein n=1 Tax=Pyricularia oryzae TaxID=318829 RepID=A0A4P7NGV2_PYROR|nr:hypothetical protein PoMZ_08137 [Pyricularia oryzae]